MMKISNEKPACYPHLEAKFGKIWEKGVLITIGDTIHTIRPNVGPQMMAHEEVHMKQQLEMGVDKFIRTYLRDNEFRLKVELEAHKVEAAYVRTHVHNRKKQATALDYIHRSLAENYQDIISYDEARKLV